MLRTFTRQDTSEPSGAEVAAPADGFTAADENVREPDPAGRVHRDGGRLIRVDTAVVPPRIAAGGVARVHLLFHPSPERQAHWNNEAEPLRVWLNPPTGWSVDRKETRAPQPPVAVSNESRELQLELKAPPARAAGRVSLPGYALYYVCEKADGVCMYRRQDVAIPVVVSPGK